MATPPIQATNYNTGLITASIKSLSADLRWVFQLNDAPQSTPIYAVLPVTPVSEKSRVNALTDLVRFWCPFVRGWGGGRGRKGDQSARKLNSEKSFSGGLNHQREDKKTMEEKPLFLSISELTRRDDVKKMAGENYYYVISNYGRKS